MKSHLRCALFIVLSASAPASLLSATDLSVYREFHLGSSPADIAKLTRMESSAANLVSSRPERIEELDWNSNLPSSTGIRSDSVREIRFSFYNGSLFEMMVSYDREHTSGLTDTDVTDALSAIYGPASRPVAKEMSFNSGYTSTVRVIAQWGDAQSQLSLIGLSYGDGYGLIVSSKDTLALARRAIAESERLDRVEAPQRALDERAKQAAATEAKDQKLRLVNKPGFRP